MQDLRVSNPKDLCHSLVQAGKALEIGGKIEVLLSGSHHGHAVITRQDRDTLLCQGALSGSGEFKQVLKFYGEYVGEPPPGSLNDLYADGGRFSAEGCPRVKPGLEPSIESLNLAKEAKRAMCAWLKSLPKEMRQGLRA